MSRFGLVCSDLLKVLWNLEKKALHPPQQLAHTGKFVPTLA
jgi:hypothetical protein